MNPQDLLEIAVPPMPADLQAAPIAQIRRRVHRRRRLAVTVGAAVLVVAIGVAIPLVGGARLAPPVVGSSALATSVVSWQFVRVARDGLELTVYAMPGTGSCFATGTSRVSRLERTDQVVITVRGLIQPDGCAAPGAAEAVGVRLTTALGGRAVVDGAVDQPRTSFSDRELPLPPDGAGYAEVWSTFSAGSAENPICTVGYTRPGGPDISITARTKRHAAAPVGTPSGPLRLGRRSGAVYTEGAYAELRWDAGDLVYELTAEPAEGTTLSLAQFRTLVGSLHWDQ